MQFGELLLDLRYFRNSVTPVISAAIGELLPGLRFIRNGWNAPRLSVKVNYYLDYGASETSTSLQLPAGRVNYYLDYRTFETGHLAVPENSPVNYYLDYRTSETNKAPSAGSTSVNYCLIYGTSETNGEVRTILQVVNYCLDYRTSETPRLKVKKRKQGELLPGLPYLRNGSTPGKAWAPGELLLGLRYL